MSLLGLYVHVPFCSRRCDYCDFYVVVGRESERERFARRMADSIAQVSARLPEEDREADTIYLGGGTPSLLDAGHVRLILDACRRAFRIHPAAEVTLEANPEGIDAEILARWLDAGVNRLSVGVQAIQDMTLRQRGRLHTGEEALEAIELARAAGFRNVNADLVAGLPAGQGPGSAPDVVSEVTGSVGAVLARRPDHLSLYLLETDKRTPLMRAVEEGRERLPSGDRVAEAFEAARGILEGAGYEHYEISNFCLPGRRSRHNLKYWTGTPYLGFGPAAFSSYAGRFFSTPGDLDGFLHESGREEDHTLSGREASAREALILNLRLLEGVDLEAFDRRWGTALGDRVPAEVADLAEAGLVVLDGTRLKLSRSGVLLANELFERLSPAPEDPARSFLTRVARAP
jgi:oxygen-independent coproporphyrinogen-3 oxidase